MEINTDYRIALRIFDAFTDEAADTKEKYCFMLEMLYKDTENIQDAEEAIEKAVWYLNCGKVIGEDRKTPPLYNWEQDEQMIFSAVNKVAGMETRNIPYMHYWTWMGYFSEIDDGLFTNVVAIRNKRNRGMKLVKGEQEFYINNKNLIELDYKDKKELENSINRSLEEAGII